MVKAADPKIMEIAANQNVFHEGTLAFYDTFAGLIPCKVLEVKESGFGFRCGPYDVIKFKLTADCGAYKKGEILTADAMRVPPRKMVRRHKYSNSIKTLYKYAPLDTRL